MTDPDDETPDEKVNSYLGGFGLHACAGLNACHGQDFSGAAKMAGTGACATAVPHHCAGNNACAGQAGCGYSNSSGTTAQQYDQQAHPSGNTAPGNGGCGSPIGNGNTPGPYPDLSWKNTDGPNKGKSVWDFARAQFETRMSKLGIPFGPAPKSGG